MFREMRRSPQAISHEECIEILKHELRGVISVIGDDGYPYGTPIDHYYNEDDGKIYFHTAKIGHRVDAIKACDKVSYCVYDEGYRKEGEWALNIKSVVIFGRIEIVEDQELSNYVIRQLCYKFTDDEAYIDAEFESSGRAVMTLALTPEHMTGKLVNEA